MADFGPTTLDPFEYYKGMLLRIDEQLKRLRDYNEWYWGNVIPEEAFAAVSTSIGNKGSGHIQTVQDLKILHVQFGTDEKTFRNWLAVINGEQPNFQGSYDLFTGYRIRRLAENTIEYPPGIHAVHIDLAAHRYPGQGRSVNEVREQVRGTPETLAHAEVLAAYALHPELLQAADGTKLPRFDSAGYKAKSHGDKEWQNAPYGGYYEDGCRVSVGFGWTVILTEEYAAPVVWQE